MSDTHPVAHCLYEMTFSTLACDSMLFNATFTCGASKKRMVAGEMSIKGGINAGKHMVAHASTVSTDFPSQPL
jgi:hypothetical protein